jgi:hypothetical protein
MPPAALAAAVMLDTPVALTDQANDAATGWMSHRVVLPAG